MSDHFLSALMRTAKDITQAERALAVDVDLNVLETLNLDTPTLNSAHFQEVATGALRRGLDNNEAIITNNIITDPAQAPVTNTNFTDLRVVVVIPVKGRGAVYLDQHIRHGIIPRQTIDKLMRLVRQVMSSAESEPGAEALHTMYQQMN
ncbi:MAG: hypothetical protein HXY40_16205 [Chloroflexi bacterium]|nr:hypothetical protein [Chloroflexota bacterium]